MNDVIGLDIPAHTRKTNGFAVASLVTGILPTVVLGLVFGVLGIFRARRIGRGMTMSLVGIVLSLVWIAPIVYVAPHMMKAMDPGCRAAQQIQDQYSQTRLAADFDNPPQFKADLDALIAGLTDAAAKANSDEARKYMILEADDQRAVEATTAVQQISSAGMFEQFDKDQTALQNACGAF
jgi:hypothetical protein